MTHSPHYIKVKTWFDMKMWNIARVRNAVIKGWITQDEYSTITGELYY